jgi:LuxR family maltose regulon positive regulatory protein
MSGNTSVAAARSAQAADGSRLLAKEPGRGREPARGKEQARGKEPAGGKEPGSRQTVRSRQTARSRPRPALGTMQLLKDDSFLRGSRPVPGQDGPDTGEQARGGRGGPRRAAGSPARDTQADEKPAGEVRAGQVQTGEEQPGTRQAGAQQPGSQQPGGGRTADAAQLLGDKLQIPRLSLAVLRRRRLIDLIGRAAAHRVTVVSGAAGAGKTIACASWASTGPARRVAWLTLDSYDREPARFWASLRASLGCSPAGRTGPLRAAQDAAPGDDFPLRLIEAAQLLTEPVTVVLDDVHELVGSPVLPGLDLLIRHAPPMLRLILAGRCPPQLQLARLRVAGELADIGAADLACTIEEADAYFAMLGLGVTAAERDELLRRTEGWMAGLRLAAMSVRDSPQDGAALARIAGDQPIITDYLWDEVLGRQPAQARLLMLRTSVTEQMTGDLADALTGEPGGARTLERLSRENSFVEALGDDHGSYRYHPLLRDVLMAQLRRERPREIPVLLGRVARWHADRGQTLAAVRAAAEAGDWDYAGQVLAEAGIAALLAADPAAVDKVLALFPPDRRAGDPAVAMALAAAALCNGDPDEAAQHLDRAAAALRRRARAGRAVLELTLAALQVMATAGAPGAEISALAESRLSAAQPPGSGPAAEHRAAGLFWFALGTAQLSSWDTWAARRALKQADRQLAAGGLGELRARARGWLALALAWDGELTAARQAASELSAPAGASAAGTASEASACLAALASAHVCLARDDLPGARRLLDEAEQCSFRQLPGEPLAPVVAALARARVALAGADATGARGLLLRLRDTWAEGDGRLDAPLALLDSEIAVRSGDTVRAHAALAHLEAAHLEAAALARRPDPVAHQQGTVAHQQGTVALQAALLRSALLISEADFDGALAALRTCLDSAADAVTAPVKIAALVAGAIAHRRLGAPAAAAELLGQALALAEHDQAYRVFLDAGQAARSAITVLVPPTSPCANFAGRILERFDSQLHRAEAAPGQAEALTQSEIAVLRFLPSQMTNQEIAEALFLSINTVKTHLRSVYRKLEVASRRQAIARGRQLGLL